jgi:uncharacterized membrane protein YcaP (DUF421 family)
MEWLDVLLGLGEEAKDLSALQMAARAFVVYLLTLAIVRLGKKRFMGRASAFDVIVGIVIGSVASRAITGNAPLAPALAAAAVIMALHWLFSAIAVRSHFFGKAIKGRTTVLVRDGIADEKALAGVHMTMRDLEEALREQGMTELANVFEARLERDGSVSLIKKQTRPRIVEIEVAEGVQRVRLEVC